MTEDKLHILIEKYSNGTASEEEALMLEKIISSAEKKIMESSINDFESAKTKQRIFNEIKKKTKQPRTNLILKIAATVLVLLGITSFLMFQNIRSTNTIVFNDTNEPIYISLPDSTKVVLNTNGELQYSEKFNETTREIILKGEANFDVSSNRKKPFIVHTEHISTKVLGTEFNVKENDDFVTVTVTEGVVSVSNKIDSIQLQPNQQIVFNATSNQLIKKEVIASHYILWYQEEINLNNLSLYEVAEILENLYNTSIDFKNEEDKNIKMSISFNRNEDFDKILERINFVNNVKFKKKGNEVIVQ